MNGRRAGSSRGDRRSSDKRGSSRGGSGGFRSNNSSSDRRGGSGGNSGGGYKGNSGPKEMHKAVCADCGKSCEVPFKPTGERPVYCRECFGKHNTF